MILTKFVLIFIALEVLLVAVVSFLRRDFQWLITSSDEMPDLDESGLKKFIDHGFDPEIGWVRKPNTSHVERGKYGETFYNIGPDGERLHPGLDGLKNEIACFGDSFTFSRQVNDRETWPYLLSRLSGKGVLNFGVGNYGIDQALIRMKREIKNKNISVVIMGVVPSTIVRILSVWKHYNEFGNTFGFKPRFNFKNGELIEVKNIVDNEDKLRNYRKYIREIRENDYFYKTKFRDEMIRFPYLYTVLKKPFRNIPIISALLLSFLFKSFGIRNIGLEGYPMMKIMDINRRLRVKLFQNEYASSLFKRIVLKFKEEAQSLGAIPVFLFMPQKDDILFIKKREAYYDKILKDIGKEMLTIDMTGYLMREKDLDLLYSDENVYGGHYSREGNRLVASVVYDVLQMSVL